MTDLPYVSPRGLYADGGFLITHGSPSLGMIQGGKFGQVRYLASKVALKLAYRGAFVEYDQWKHTIELLAHSLRISLRLVPPGSTRIFISLQK